MQPQRREPRFVLRSIMSQALTDILQHPAIWRVGQIPANIKPAIPTGFVELDRALPAHGWEQGAMSEILANEQGIGELSLIAPALRLAMPQGTHLPCAATPARCRRYWWLNPHSHASTQCAGSGIARTNANCGEQQRW